MSFRVAEYNALRPRGFYWKRRFPTKAAALAAIARFFERNPFSGSTLQPIFDKRNV
jgi:hypothetical protein